MFDTVRRYVLRGDQCFSHDKSEMAIIAVLKGLKWRRYLDNNLTKALISGIEILSCYAITLIKLDDS